MLNPLALISIVIKKDLKELLGDKRTLSNLLTIVVFMPLLMAAGIGFIANKVKSDSEKSYDIHVVKQHAFKDFETQAIINEHKVIYTEAVDLDKIQNNEVGVFVQFGADFSKNLKKGIPAEIFIYYDDKNEKSKKAYGAAQSVLAHLDNAFKTNRLLVKGVNLEFLKPFDIKVRKISKHKGAEEAYLVILNMLFIYCVLFTVPLITPDIITGERERRFLEPLIQLPLNRTWFLVARSLLFIIIGVVASLIGIGLFTGIMSLPAYQELTGFYVIIDFSLVVTAFFIFLPITFVIAWGAIYIGSLAKTIKEAQVLIGIFSSVIFMGVFSITFIPDELKDTLIKVPFVGQAILFDRLKSNLIVTAMDIGFVTAISLMLGVIFAMLSVSLYKKESLIVKSH